MTVLYQYKKIKLLLVISVLLPLLGCDGSKSKKVSRMQAVSFITINCVETTGCSLETSFKIWAQKKQMTLKKGLLTSAHAPGSFLYFVYMDEKMIFVINNLKVNMDGEIALYSGGEPFFLELKTWLEEEGFRIEVRKKPDVKKSGHPL